MKKRNIVGSVISVLMLGVGLGSCNLGQTQVVQETEFQKQNDEFVTKISEDPTYQSSDFGGIADHKYYYKVIESAPEGNKEMRAYQNSRVLVEYSVTLAYTNQVIEQMKQSELTIFDVVSSRSLSQVFGLQYALQEMRVGDRWEVIVPWQLGYGAYSNGLIPAFSTLKYDVKLLGITKL